jgi:RNA polymerase sigma-32 factor
MARWIIRQLEDDMTAVLAMPALPSPSKLSAYLAVVHNFPALDLNEEQTLVEQFRATGDIDAAYRLVTSHLRLAAKIALGYRNYGLPIADLISEANLGLMIAVKKYDPDKSSGARLGTYAMWWIKACVTEFVINSWSLVKGATDKVRRKLFFSLGAIKSKLGVTSDILSEDQAKLIAADQNVPAQDVLELHGMLYSRDFSLDTPLVEGSSRSFVDALPSEADNQEQVLGDRQVQQRIASLAREALNLLDDRERDIIRLRYMVASPLTRDEIGVKYGVSRESIRKWEIKAMDKLKAHLLDNQEAPTLLA